MAGRVAEGRRGLPSSGIAESSLGGGDDPWMMSTEEFGWNRRTRIRGWGTAGGRNGRELGGRGAVEELGCWNRWELKRKVGTWLPSSGAADAEGRRRDLRCWEVNRPGLHGSGRWADAEGRRRVG